MPTEGFCVATTQKQQLCKCKVCLLFLCKIVIWEGQTFQFKFKMHLGVSELLSNFADIWWDITHEICYGHMGGAGLL